MDIKFNKEFAEYAAKIYASKHLAVQGTVSELGFSEEECKHVQEATALELFSSPLKEVIANHISKRPSILSNSYEHWCDDYEHMSNELISEFQIAKKNGSVYIPEINNSTVIAVEVNYKGEEDGEYLIYNPLKDIHSTFISKYNYSK